MPGVATTEQQQRGCKAPVSGLVARGLDNNYSQHYNEDSFKLKLARSAKAVGRVVLENLLILFFVLKDGDTPLRAKMIVVSVLGYFILPLDLIPDWILGGGFTDDAAAIAAAIGAVSAHIKPEHKDQAKAKAAQWLGVPP